MKTDLNYTKLEVKWRGRQNFVLSQRYSLMDIFKKFLVG